MEKEQVLHEMSRISEQIVKLERILTGESSPNSLLDKDFRAMLVNLCFLKEVLRINPVDSHEELVMLSLVKDLESASLNSQEGYSEIIRLAGSWVTSGPWSFWTKSHKKEWTKLLGRIRARLEAYGTFSSHEYQREAVKIILREKCFDGCLSDREKDVVRYIYEIDGTSPAPDKEEVWSRRTSAGMRFGLTFEGLSDIDKKVMAALEAREKMLYFLEKLPR